MLILFHYKDGNLLHIRIQNKQVKVGKFLLKTLAINTKRK